MKDLIFVWFGEGDSECIMLFWCEHCQTWHVARVIADDGERLSQGANTHKEKLDSNTDFGLAWISARTFANGSDEPDIFKMEDVLWQPDPPFSLN